MVNFRASVSGNALSKLDRLEHELEEFNPLDIAARIVRENLKNRFLQTVDPDGQVWEPSRAALRRQANGRSGKTLFDTGRLFRSIQIHDQSDDSVKVGIPSSDDRNTRIGKVHQVTGFRGTVRRFIGINDKDVSDVTNELNKRLKRLLK